jgi:hypothetical protein
MHWIIGFAVLEEKDAKVERKLTVALVGAAPLPYNWLNKWSHPDVHGTSYSFVRISHILIGQLLEVGLAPTTSVCVTQLRRIVSADPPSQSVCDHADTGNSRRDSKEEIWAISSTCPRFL